jgi:hypothetical protein
MTIILTIRVCLSVCRMVQRNSQRTDFHEYSCSMSSQTSVDIIRFWLKSDSKSNQVTCTTCQVLSLKRWQIVFSVRHELSQRRE